VSDFPGAGEPFDEPGPLTPEPDEQSAEGLLLRLLDILASAKTLPLSTTIRVEKEESVGLLQAAIDRLPGELKEARFLLKEREEFLAKAGHEADEIISAARVRAERMVQRTEVAREANAYAQRTVDEAREEALRLRHEAEDYCDQKLAGFEIVLERTLKTVGAGREKLRVTPLPPAAEGQIGFIDSDVDDGAAFFDQDSL